MDKQQKTIFNLMRYGSWILAFSGGYFISRDLWTGILIWIMAGMLLLIGYMFKSSVEEYDEIVK